MRVVVDVPEQRYGQRVDDAFTMHRYIEPTAVTVSNNTFLTAVLGDPRRIHFSSRDKLATWSVTERSWNYAGYDVPTVSLGLQAIHQCFAAHKPVALWPDTVWYMIIHQIAEHVKINPDVYAGLFASTPGEKRKIIVRDDSLRYNAPSNWGRTIQLFRTPLISHIGEQTTELFLPKFSTTTVEDEVAALVCFMDAASPYYEYEVWTKCHIPQIRLEGTAVDWTTLYKRAEALASRFPLLEAYFADLLPVLKTVAGTAAGVTPDPSFWGSIYKYESTSGAQWVTGWFNAFFAHVYTPEGARQKEVCDWRSMADKGWPDGIATNQFPSHVSTVPFVWEYFDTRYDMVFAGGILGVDNDSGFLAPRLGFAVAER